MHRLRAGTGPRYGAGCVAARPERSAIGSSIEQVQRDRLRLKAQRPLLCAEEILSMLLVCHADDRPLSKGPRDPAQPLVRGAARCPLVGAAQPVGLSLPTLRQRLAAIASRHTTEGLETPTDHPLVRRMLRALRPHPRHGQKESSG